MQDIGQSNNKWNGYAIDYQAESLPLTDSLATHFSSTQIIPPRPQRPFTEYNVSMPMYMSKTFTFNIETTSYTVE